MENLLEKFKLFFTLLLLVSVTVSCSNEADSLLSEEKLNIEELKLIVQEKYDAKLEITNEEQFTVIYNNGTKLEAKKLDSNSYLMSGSALGRNEYIFEENLFDKEKPSIAFKENINGSENFRSPCDQHPSNEGFNECFKREFDEFCDGFLGCVALATNPAIISGVIAGHCLACEAFSEEEKDDDQDDSGSNGGSGTFV